MKGTKMNKNKLFTQLVFEKLINELSRENKITIPSVDGPAKYKKEQIIQEYKRCINMLAAK